jgi:hypothetical protein
VRCTQPNPRGAVTVAISIGPPTPGHENSGAVATGPSVSRCTSMVVRMHNTAKSMPSCRFSESNGMR